ncbi:AAA family ATPase [Agarivorans albus]|uniref:endopeptidase La n=1 Tax=Agarivorans albus MKT 106 TaxID=1331007 RepID=R9PT23_AGAAL|nr:AAA family ATPase [Agarivorans albus]GAD01671.1 ATP-dependent protease La Type II [Agarivorans albus MKT 106]
MTESALSIEKLKPNFSLENINPTNGIQWSSLLPIAKSSFDHFTHANNHQQVMVCQAPSFFNLHSVLADFAKDLNIEQQAYALIFNPTQPQRPYCVELSQKAQQAFEQTMLQMEDLLNKDFGSELLAKEIGEELAFMEESQSDSLSKILKRLNQAQVPEQLLNLIKQLFEYLVELPSFTSIQKFYKTWLNKPTLNYCYEFTRATIFGQYLAQPTANSAELVEVNLGAIHHSASGILVLNAEDILAEAKLWFELKACLTTSIFSWDKLQGEKLTSQPQHLSVTTKLVLIGNANAIADLYELDPSIKTLGLLETELPLEVEASSTNINLYLSHLNGELHQCGLSSLTTELYECVLNYAAKLCEHQQYLSLDVQELITLLQSLELNQFTANSQGFTQALKHLNDNVNNQQKFSDLSYTERQTNICLSGEQVGQINGLSVIDFAGLGLSFGEPIRITANVFQGDGDFNDIERKAELAGNVHAKSMMIIHGFLNQLFASEHHFPYSGNIVFEQSYHEIDGDSASLASALALLSAISKLPIQQNTAVTGALDQKGNVLAVGGINEKIEGYLRVAQLVNTNQPIRVVIPEANLNQLNLSQEVLNAVEQKQLSIFAVSTISQAVPYLFNLPAGDLLDEESVYGKINKLINLPNDEPGLIRWLLKKVSDLFKF